MDQKTFFNYPKPLRGPEVPYKNERKSNPAMRGPVVYVCALLMEWLRVLRELVYHNAGFSSIRKLFPYLVDYEPLYDPTVVPLEGRDTEKDDAPEPALASPAGHLSPKHGTSAYYSVDDYHELYMSGEVTPVDVAATLLSLIRKDVDNAGPHAAAWFDVKADVVMKAAEASTLRYQQNLPLGILDGVPAAVKDEYEMEDYVTCLGTRNDYSDTAAGSQSTTTWCVKKLQEAGCVILGKLHMVEFGLDTPGNNPNFPHLPNPYNRGYYTGGSSSGAGYAVGAGLIPIALGSDGGGSIRIPSSFCSVFGLKPTHGRLSFYPQHNHSNSCACLGPLAADIRSLAALLEVVGQPHPTSPFPRLPPISSVLRPSQERPKLLGVPDVWVSRSTPAVQLLFRDFVQSLVDSHNYAIVPITIPFLVEGQIAHAMTVLNDGTTLLPDTSSFTATTRILLAIGSVTPATDLHLAQKLRRLLMQHLAYLWKQHPGMVIATPTTSCAGWPVRSKSELTWGISDGDRTLKTMEYVWLANFCGLPSLTVPMGYVIPEGQPRAGDVAGPDVEGRVPVGFMATGEWASEVNLLQFGMDAEEVGTGKRARSAVWVDVVKAAKGRK